MSIISNYYYQLTVSVYFSVVSIGHLGMDTFLNSLFYIFPTLIFYYHFGLL